MSYKVKELFYTLQGEGAQVGRPAVFCRFSGCNLWSGREVDRHKAICQFCDTDFWGTDGQNGGVFATADALANRIIEFWPKKYLHIPVFVVCTGGEPLLQLDSSLIHALHQRQVIIAVETNGTIEPPPGIDWLCVSPKANTQIVVRKGQELKLVFPQQGIDPQSFENWSFEHFYLQPMDSPKKEENTKAALAYCLEHPQWRISLQTHKILNID